MGHGHVHLMSNHLQTFCFPHVKNNTPWQLPCCLPLKHANFHYILDLTTSNINKNTSHNYNNNYKYVPPGFTVVKNLPTNAGYTRDAVLTPQWGRSLEQEMAVYSSILAWEIQWTEEPGRLQSMGSQRQTQPRMHALCAGYCVIYLRVISHFNLYKCPMR